MNKEELVSAIDEINAEIEQLQNQLENLELQISELEDKKYEFEKEISALEKSDKTAKLLDKIHSITQDNTIYEHLHKDTPTTPIMDSFSNSPKEFLVFSKAYTIPPHWKHVSLVVTKSCNDVNYSYSGLTMTDLKKSIGTHIADYLINMSSEKSRKYYLYNELLNIAKRYDLNKGDMIPFETPCQLGGQTYKDQTGFGWEYCGEDVVLEGREYGETTKFLIIGIIVED